MTAKTPTRKHIGQPVEFSGSQGQTIYGHLKELRHGIATIEFSVPGKWELFTAYKPAKEVKVL